MQKQADVSVVDQREWKCDFCETLMQGAVFEFDEWATNIDGERLGHICPACQTVSCDGCKKTAIHFSWWSGYDNSRCARCRESIPTPMVVLRKGATRPVAGQIPQPAVQTEDLVHHVELPDQVDRILAKRLGWSLFGFCFVTMIFMGNIYDAVLSSALPGWTFFLVVALLALLGFSLIDWADGIEIISGEAAGIFEPGDYWPHVFGVMIIGGLILVPQFWGRILPNFIEILNDITTMRLMLGSFMGAALHAFSFSKRGQFILGRMIAGFALFLFMIFKASLDARTLPGTVALPGGVLGFLIFGLSGWIGIWLGRFTGISKTFRVIEKSKDPLS